jgi:hypothetical protein
MLVIWPMFYFWKSHSFLLHKFYPYFLYPLTGIASTNPNANVSDLVKKLNETITKYTVAT